MEIDEQDLEAVLHAVRSFYSRYNQIIDHPIQVKDVNDQAKVQGLVNDIEGDIWLVTMFAMKYSLGKFKNKKDKEVVQ